MDKQTRDFLEMEEQYERLRLKWQDFAISHPAYVVVRAKFCVVASSYARYLREKVKNQHRMRPEIHKRRPKTRSIKTKAL